MFSLIGLFGLLSMVTLVLIALAVLYFQGKRAPSTSGQYVALGSSFAAGIGLGPREPGSPFICMRSTHGYPQLLARMTGLSLVDMSCSGSTTEHILHGGQLFLGPQLAAIGPGTRLVTITSGGNDVNYIGDLMLASGRAGVLGKLYTKPLKSVAERDFARVESNFRQIVSEIKHRVPDSQVVLVSYPNVVPGEGDCAVLGIGPEMANIARQVAANLHEATRKAAEDAGAIFVDMGAASIGHDAYAADPWVNGASPPKGAPFHPSTAGAQATAEAVFKAIS
jgi:lysophospholipase L1-like esterase